MKFLVAVSAFLVLCSADPKPGFVAITPLAYTAPVVAIPSSYSSQYHSQDGIGQYSYGYSNDLAAKNEVRSRDGTTVGSYSYIDAEGKLQNVQYRSDAVHGFRVSASNLPVPTSPEMVPSPEPVQDTPEVVAARSAHMAAVEQAKQKIHSAHVAVKSIEPTVVHPVAFRTAEVVHQPLFSAPIVAAPNTYSYYFDNVHYPYIVQPYFRSVHAPFVARIEEIKEVPQHVEKVEEVVVESARASSEVPQVVSRVAEVFGSKMEKADKVEVESARANVEIPHVASRVAEVIASRVEKVEPVVPKDTPEVAKARAEHLDFVEKIKKNIASTH